MSQTTPTLSAVVREKIGTRYAARDRKAGFLPAVIYGHKTAAEHVNLSAKEFYEQVVQAEAHLINIQIGDKTESVVLKDVQWDAFSRNIIHVDLERVDLDEVTTVSVPLTLIGEAAALKIAGTYLSQVVTHLHISCKAKDLPSHIDLDIAEITQEKPLTVADLKLADGVTCTEAEDIILAQVGVAKGATKTEETEEAEATEE